MGADSLADLPNWRQPERICELAIPVVVRRAGSPEPDDTCFERLMSPERLAIARKIAWKCRLSISARPISATESPPAKASVIARPGRWRSISKRTGCTGHGGGMNRNEKCQSAE